MRPSIASAIKMNQMLNNLAQIPWWLWYVAVINVAAFLAFGIDKARSRRVGARRTPEATLWILMLLGGSVGALMAMNYFRHKTKKLSFQAVAALILALQILLVYFFLNKN